jgi:hypothetical protein
VPPGRGQSVHRTNGGTVGRTLPKVIADVLRITPAEA